MWVTLRSLTLAALMAFTINSAKEAGVTRMPLHLFDFTWPDAYTLSVCTHAVVKDAVTYLPLVMEQKIDPIQALSPTGIEIPPSVRLTLADANKDLHEIEDARGFRGVRLRVTFAFYDWVAAEWSTDSLVPFVGRCDEPEVTDDALIVSAGYILNLEAKRLPAFPIQPRCPKLFPYTAAMKALASVPGSPYYACGVTDSSKTSCTFTQAGCDANANTLRFGGQTWSVPSASKSREYISGNWLSDLQSDPYDSKNGDYVPLVYGTAWVEGLGLGTWPEANSTRQETILCEGRPGAILKVVAQDELLPASNDLDYNAYHVADPLLRYDVVSNGERTGRRNPDVPWNGDGDPHGSQCVIAVVVYHKLTASKIQVRALITGPQVRAYAKIASITGGVVTLADGAVNEDIAGNSPFTITIFGNSNGALNATWGLSSWTAGPPGTVTLSGTSAAGTGGYIAYQASSDRYAWAILGVLERAGLAIGDVDLDAFITANRSHRAVVNYTARDGSAASHPKYVCSLVVRQRRTAAEIVTGLLRGCGSHLGRNPATGLIGLYARGSLAAQQPATVDGSNYNTVSAGGYFAYHFDESTMVRDQALLTRRGRAAGSVPNLVTIGFANEENEYSGDSVAVPDADEIERMGQEMPAALTVDGCTALDRANRVGSMFLAEQIDGPAWAWVTTAKAVKLRVGHLVALSNVKHGFDHAPFRLLEIAPENNWETCRLVATRHVDGWYADDFTSIAGNVAQGSRRDKLARPSWAWAPYEVQPASGDPLYGLTDWTFGMQLGYERLEGGELQPVVTITGRVPVNDPSNLLPPVLAPQGTTADSGGAVPGAVSGVGKTYYIAVASRDADGLPGPVSKACQVVVAQSGDDNTITAGVSFWDPAGSGYFVFAGVMPNRLMATNDAGYSGTPSSVTVTSIPEATWGAPDTEFDRLIARPAICEHEGLFGVEIAGAVATRSITIPGAGWSTNQWAGYDCTVLAKADLSAIGVLNFRVASNTATVLTIDGASPDPAALGVVPGDVLVMLSKPTVSGLRLTDAGWVNTLSGGGLGLVPGEEVGRILRIVVGPGRGYRYKIGANGTDWVEVEGPWVVTPTSASRYVIEDAAQLPDQAVSQAIANGDPAAGITLSAPVRNYAGRSLTIEMVTVDGGGAESAPQWNPVRCIFVPGAAGTRVVTASTTQRRRDGTILHDTGAGNQTLQLLASPLVRNQALLVRKATADAHTVTITTAVGDTFPDGSTSLVLSTDDIDGAVLLRFPGAGNVVIPISGAVAGSTGATGGTARSTTQTLTANATVNSPATPADGDLWVLRLDQNATGGWVVTWGTGVMLGPVINGSVNSDPSTMCLMVFAGIGGKWYLSGTPILGVPIV